MPATVVDSGCMANYDDWLLLHTTDEARTAAIQAVEEHQDGLITIAAGLGDES